MSISVAILLEEQYQELEAWYPYFRLIEEGYSAYFIAPEKRVYPSKKGYPARADISVFETDPERFAAVVIPGGFAPDYMRRTPEMVSFVKGVYKNGGVVAALCHGGWMLASAGIISGKKVTSFFAIADDMKNAGGVFVDESVVVDGRIITSRTPDDLPVFSAALLKKLST